MRKAEPGSDTEGAMMPEAAHRRRLESLPESSLKAKRFVVLDGWRGICALLVALAHADFLGHFYEWGLVRNGHLFVDFFFVLSGFVIAHAYSERIGSWRGFANFAVRRIGRLWPLHIALLLAFIAIEIVLLIAQSRGLLAGFRPAFTDSSPVAAIPTNVLLIQALGMHDFPTFNRPSWSISTELYGNLLLGLIWMLLPSRRALLAALVVAALSAVAVFTFSPAYLRTVVGVAFFRCLYGLMIGYLIYEFLRRTIGGRLPAASLVEIACLTIVAAYVWSAGETVWTMAAPLIFGAAILVFAREEGVISRLLRSAPFVRLGEWSYSIYMVHYLILTFIAVAVRMAEPTLGMTIAQPIDVGGATIKLITAGGRTAMDVMAILYLAIVVAVAAGTYRLIEVPTRDRFNGWARRLSNPGVR